MHGVVSLLDEAHQSVVEALWRELKSRFGVGNPDVTHYPHFSYHIAAEYDLDRLAFVLERGARETAGFTVHAGGLGIFTGAEPVLYVPVARNPALTTLHQALWPELESISRDGSAYYAPTIWLPHITLGHGDVSEENLGPIVSWLNRQSLTWEIRVNNLSLILEDNGRYTLPYRFPLASRSGSTILD